MTNSIMDTDEDQLLRRHRNRGKDEALEQGQLRLDESELRDKLRAYEVLLAYNAKHQRAGERMCGRWAETPYANHARGARRYLAQCNRILVTADDGRH